MIKYKHLPRPMVTDKFDMNQWIKTKTHRFDGIQIIMWHESDYYGYIRHNCSVGALVPLLLPMISNDITPIRNIVRKLVIRSDQGSQRFDLEAGKMTRRMFWPWERRGKCLVWRCWLDWGGRLGEGPRSIAFASCEQWRLLRRGNVMELV